MHLGTMTPLPPQTLSKSIAKASEQLTSPALASPITRLYLPITGLIYRFHDSNCRNQLWFLQLESCNSVSANLHGCVGHSGLHDIYAADDSVKLMIGGEPFSVETGRSVNQTVASSRIRRIGEECGDLEISPGFRK